MPSYFSNVFRARPMLEHVPLEPQKNYSTKGYACLNDDYTKIFERFEEKDEELPVVESKSEMKKRVKKEKIIAHI